MIIKAYKEAEAMLKHLLTALGPDLTDDAKANAYHYLNHSELEMSYEILCLGLIEQKKLISLPLQGLLYDLGIALRLDKESVYDEHFWQHLLSWIKTSSDL